MASQSSDDPLHRYANERQRVKDSDLSQADADAVLEFLAALDENDMTAVYRNEKGEQETLAYTSLMDYGRGLRMLGQELDCDLLRASLSDIQQATNEMVETLSKQTVRQRQAAARKFYRYHDETAVNGGDIPLISVDSQSDVDERSTLTQSDIQSIRDACDNLRDRAMIELFIYTGQRLRAIQTLRIQDIDLDEGVYYLNTDEAGLKNADKVGGKRPLLGAEKHVRQWIKNHPTGEPDDYLITTLPSATRTNGPGEHLSKVAIYNRLDKLFRKADVDKPDGQMAHTFRHYFVTVCYRDYGMNPSTIKHLIGHTEASTVMETTYQHLTDQDHIDAARAATESGRDNDEERDAFTPVKCPTCNEPLAPDAKACEDCGAVFAPNAQATKETLQGNAEERVIEAETETEAEIVRGVLQDIRKNPDQYLSE